MEDIFKVKWVKFTVLFRWWRHIVFLPFAGSNPYFLSSAATAELFVGLSEWESFGRSRARYRVQSVHFCGEDGAKALFFVGFVVALFLVALEQYSREPPPVLLTARLVLLLISVKKRSRPYLLYFPNVQIHC